MRGARPYRAWRWLGIPAVLLLFSLCFAMGYGLSALLFHFTGAAAPIVSHILSGLLGFALFAAGAKLVTKFHAFGDSHSKWEDKRNRLLNDTIGAMERIARGDFGVFIPVEEHSPFSEVAQSVNRMARELGSMENLRQDFISNVSHEMQSPLTSISGFAALLKNESLTPELFAHYIDVIETEAKRLSKLCENLLRLSSLENNAQLAIAPFSLDRQIRNAALALEPQWTEKQIALSLSLDKIVLRADEELLSQVWINLLQNAIKFTPQGGRIDVSLTGDDRQSVCRIADTGIGISDEEKMHIFERFYKADKSRNRQHGGSGLGLSLVKKIVELHGGTVQVESQVNCGSTFSVSLPARI